MAESHWTPALQTIEETSTGIYGPESFRDYIGNIGEDSNNYRTAAEISIDTKRDLANELRQNHTMVLRLGSAPEGLGTQFALVRVTDHLDDFFINEDEFNLDNRTELDYSPDGADIDSLRREAQDMLSAYRLLSRFSESSLVNLALSTGILSRALNLDVEQIGTAPMTIASTFDFKFEPHPAQPTVVHHNNGQVEIDALVTTRRNGKRVLIVVEAKTGTKRSLAKHKLFYPMMGVQVDVSESVTDIIPVYLRAQPTNRGILYNIYECTVKAMGKEEPCLSEIRVISHTHYLLKIR